MPTFIAFHYMAREWGEVLYAGQDEQAAYDTIATSDAEPKWFSVQKWIDGKMVSSVDM